ncbi:PREDICTED: calcium-activated chloride channel regulator 4A-like [Branchiostoma belcheri]|uniref:Calcium-activated chloride channel regulator 4A-like n=1 Tax=Branchiostoma belcheri TaxID=7741 RepID=A0A6P4ZHL2_BRABE|nr:PREDICTED: calcium-activated chloride channel regulator 4A-like [Branchiostoma belcheri]
MAATPWVLLLFALAWRSEAVFTSPHQIKLQNNEYSDVLVAIHRDIPEDLRIVDRLKEILTKASEDLYIATNSRAFLKEVKILIPKTWSKKPEYQPAGTETFERANVRVDVPNALYGDNPYVQQKGGCGEAGDYMHLTPKYVLDKQYGEAYWGPNGKTFVHEWAHLRWGLFDEYGQDDPAGQSYPHFYSGSLGGVQPTRCSAWVAGTNKHMVTGAPCQLDPVTGVYGPECRFYPDEQTNRATGSYMFMHFLNQVTSFCHSDPSGDPLSYHNREAPNKHNSLCGGQSAWGVMDRHPDFANGANPPREVQSTVPDFVLLQENDYRIVLVLDASNSMRGEPLRRLGQVATRFIRSTVGFGASVGLVKFARHASIDHPVISVDSQADRDALIATIPTTTVLYTCIGCGLLKGVEALEAVGPPEGGVLLLVTDGRETTAPRIRDVIPELLRKRVIVATVAYSQNADATLESLAQQTGGPSFYAARRDSAALDNAFTATFEATAGGKGVKLLNEERTIAGGQTYTNHVHVDSSVGQNTTFSFYWLGGSRPTVTMETPVGHVITEGSPMYDVTSDTITVEIPGMAPPGKWAYNISNPGPDDHDVITIITSYPPTDGEPIRVKAQVSAVSLNYSSSQPTALRIFASVRRGYLPVTGAVVKVHIAKPPDGRVEELLLLDNGAGADVTKNDGIYSRYFLGFSADGRYGVSVTVDNSQGDAAGYTVIQRRAGSGAMPMDPDAGGSSVQQEPLQQFQRMTTGGVFEVQGVPSGGVPTVDVLPPSRVTDLAVVDVSHADATVTLRWTASGDDFDQGGPANFVELRYGRHFDQLADDFLGSPLVDQSQVLQGNLTSPPPPGHVQTVNIRVPERGHNVTFAFSLRMCDDQDNCSPPSNIVTSNLEHIAQPIKANNTVTWVIIGCVVGVAVLAAILILLYFTVCRAKKQIKPADSIHPAPTNGNTSYARTV